MGEDSPKGSQQAVAGHVPYWPKFGLNQRTLPRTLASGARGLQPGVTARYSSERVGVSKKALGARGLQPGVTVRCSSARVRVVKRGARGEVFFGASRRVRGREARRGLQPSDVRSFLRCAAANEGAEANDLQPRC